jgi:hypothetical protein
MKKEKVFYQELLHSCLTAIEQIAQKENVSLMITGKHLRTNETTGMMRLCPAIHVTVGNVSLKIWDKSSVRTLTVSHFKEALSEIMHEEVYSDLLQFILSNNVHNALVTASNDALKMDESTNLGLIRAKGRKKEGQVSDEFINGGK